MNQKNINIKKHKNKFGFTLIELLAVIIILGVLMIIAVPSVTKYIEDSRKNGYVSTAKELAGGARTLIHSGNLNLNDKDTTYYIDSECIETSNGTKTPYGELRKAYVVVNYSDDGYDYYWISVDETGTGVKKITNVEVLNTDSIENNITEADIINNLGVDARHNYVIINKDNGCSIGSSSEASVRVDTDGNVDMIDYPVGKTRKTMSFGDVIKIGNEEFYFLRYDANDAVLIARYNLKVGYYVSSDYNTVRSYSSSDPGYGLQSDECIGEAPGLSVYKCVLAFSNSNYWHEQLGEGKQYPDSYVYNSNSNLYQYIENYKSYLEGFDVTIKNAIALRNEDYVRDYYYTYGSFTYDIYFATTSWRGYAEAYNNKDYYVNLFKFPDVSAMINCNYPYMAGVRPVIII